MTEPLEPSELDIEHRLVKCDGDHGGPACEDRECWHRDSWDQQWTAQQRAAMVAEGYPPLVINAIREAQAKQTQILRHSNIIWQPHQQRVVDELVELDERRLKLAAFFGTPIFMGLDTAEQGRLLRQHLLMDALSTVLAERIEAFKP